ncbi:ABC-type transport auxiliary lipoprotein family protein [Gammaproteobacteria bacterium]|nr:ABC-type transport auxiliary lipoprotein family protein [Gammaproteobacteria bacterium]
MRSIILLSFFLVLTACSTQAPLPTDHYYRLPELRDIDSDQKRLDSISVLNFKAVGLYQERAILYTEDQIELKQYHYHHWTDSPTRLLQERLAERLRLSGISNLVLNTFEGNSALIIKGQVKAFERVQQKGSESVYVKLLLQVDSNTKGAPILHKEYVQTVILPSNNITNTIRAFAEAVDLIFNDFYVDLSEIIKV